MKRQHTCGDPAPLPQAMAVYLFIYFQSIVSQKARRSLSQPALAKRPCSQSKQANSLWFKAADTLVLPNHTDCLLAVFSFPPGVQLLVPWE